MNTETIRKYIKNIMTTALVIHNKEWTSEQQQKELNRRMNLLGLGKEVMPPFTPRPGDVVCAVPYKVEQHG